MPAPHINLQKLIVHRVDHINSDSPLLSDLVSPISDEVRDFLTEHISNNREHALARNGVFQGAPDGATDIQAVCDDLLGAPSRFVQGSQDIARHLFESVKNDKRISTGDLVVCTFSEDRNRWLALLKMDAQDSFVGHPEDVNGMVRIVLERVENVLPVAELQKCAFVLPSQLRSAKRDLIVLDQQTARYGARRVVASFFSRGFLQCGVELNQLEKTKAFFTGSFDWLNTKRDTWTERDVSRFEEVIRNSIEGEEINVASISRAAVRDSAERDEYTDYIKQRLEANQLAGLVFQPDPNVRTLSEYLEIEGDYGLKIKILAEAFGSTLETQFDQDTNTTTITIRTTLLKQSFRRRR